MKIALIALLLLSSGYNSLATEQLWYYIYVQTDYQQGPWSETEALEHEKSYNYLDAKLYDDLFGSDATEMARIIFSRLQKEDKERFTFSSTLFLSGNSDTVIIQTNNIINDFEAVKNELVATFTFNSFKAVKIIQDKQASVYMRADISVPYMNLVLPKRKY